MHFGEEEDAVSTWEYVIGFLGSGHALCVMWMSVGVGIIVVIGNSGKSRVSWVSAGWCCF